MSTYALPPTKAISHYGPIRPAFRTHSSRLLTSMKSVLRVVSCCFFFFLLISHLACSSLLSIGSGWLGTYKGGSSWLNYNKINNRVQDFL